jgi:IclR family pca regulon transcriptional regulator
VILAQARRDGYAMPEHETHEGRRSLAVPLRNRAGVAVAAMNFSAMMSRASLADFPEKSLPLLRDAAASIGEVL